MPRCPYESSDYWTPFAWIPFASFVLKERDALGEPVVFDPVAGMQEWLVGTIAKRVLGKWATMGIMALDLNPRARLAMCRAFDLVSERSRT